MTNLTCLSLSILISEMQLYNDIYLIESEGSSIRLFQRHTAWPCKDGHWAPAVTLAAESVIRHPLTLHLSPPHTYTPDSGEFFP